MPFQQFDPSLGALTGVQVLVDGTLAGSVSLENLGSVASTTSVKLPGSIAVSAVGVSLGTLDFNSGTVATATLGGFDGSKDFAGSSGTVISGTFGAAGMTGTVADAPHLAPFVGTGTVDVSLTSGGLSDVSSNAALRSLMNINTGGVVTLQYQYVPAGGTGGGNAGYEYTTFLPPTIGHLITVLEIGPYETTVAQTVTLPDQLTGWSTIASVGKFDPSLGTLLDVLVNVGNDLAGTLSVENLSTQGSVIGLNETATVSVQAPGSGTITPAEVLNNSASFLNLGAYDGTTDFTGSSGTVVSLGPAVPPSTFLGSGALSDVMDLASFTGTGTIGLAVSSKGQSDMAGPANLLSEIAQETGGTLSVSYVYIPSRGVVSNALACFAAGTHIATTNGAVAVENLREGDIVLTVSGERQPIQWIGYRRVDCRRHTSPDSVMPIRIAAHAFGGGRPNRPVLLSPDHAVSVEDVLIPIKFLLNGHTIKQIYVDSVTYYHVELPHHDVVLAEGLPVESYLETGGRGAFENSDGPIALHPDFAPDEASVAQLWRQHGYAPLLGDAGQFERARLKVLLQAQLLASKGPARRARRGRKVPAAA